jgi:hypothetical protein
MYNVKCLLPISTLRIKIIWFSVQASVRFPRQNAIAEAQKVIYFLCAFFAPLRLCGEKKIQQKKNVSVHKELDEIKKYLTKLFGNLIPAKRKAQSK